MTTALTLRHSAAPPAPDAGWRRTPFAELRRSRSRHRQPSPCLGTRRRPPCSQLPLRSLKEKVAILRTAAADRGKDLEINILIFDAIVTTDRRGAATAFLDELAKRSAVRDGQRGDRRRPPRLTVSPFGTDYEIAEHLVHVREETGASYIGVFPHLMDVFEPILNRLHGT